MVSESNQGWGEAQQPAQPSPAPPPQTASVPPPARPATQPTSGARKLSKGLLDNMDDVLDSVEVRTHPLTLQECLDLFEEYKKYLLSEGKGTIHAYFTQMQVEFYPPEEVKIVSPVKLADMYVQNQRSHMLDFYRERTKLLVRITTELREDEAARAAMKPTVLSREEMFYAMAEKNPNLAKLRDALGMQIEY